MTMALSVEHAARNRTVFREVNERIAELTGRLIGDDGSPIQLFICECSDGDCAESVQATLSDYEAIRANGARFLLAPGHELTGIDHVVDGNVRFIVVETTGQAAAIAVEHDPRHS